ncbi:Integrator complex subunit 2, partial [Caligus rogercresseyi]
MSLITIKVPIIPAGFKFVTLGLCMIIACNSLLGSHEGSAIAWLRWLVDDFESEAGNVEEMLLLMAIHFHSQQFSAVSELACTTLGMKIPIRNNNMTRIKHIFTQEVFTENVVASHAIKVPVTDKLSAGNSDSFPSTVSISYSRAEPSPKTKYPSKTGSISRSSRVSPRSIPLRHSILIPASNRGSSSSSSANPASNPPVDQTNEPISEAEVAAVFKSLKNEDFASTSLAPQMLMLYYVLLYDSVRLSYMKSIVVSNRRVLRYSQKLLSALPLKFLLRTAENKEALFGGIFPQLLRLCSTHYPHLCSVNDWLEMDDEALYLSTSSRSQEPLREKILRRHSRKS